MNYTKEEYLKMAVMQETGEGALALPQENESMGRFEQWARALLYALAALHPLWLIPWPIGVEFGREITFGALAALSIVLWLLSVLTRAELSYPRSWILWTGALMLLVFAASTFVSRAPFFSLILAGPTAERFSTFLFAFSLMALAGGILRSAKHVVFCF